MRLSPVVPTAVPSMQLHWMPCAAPHCPFRVSLPSTGAVLLGHLHLDLEQWPLLPGLFACQPHCAILLHLLTATCHFTPLWSKPGASFLCTCLPVVRDASLCQAVAAVLLRGARVRPWGLGAPSASSVSDSIQLSSALWMHSSMHWTQCPA